MCLYPRLIRNPKYTSTKKNGGVIPAINDDRVKLVPIGCGNCMECRKQKSREWQIRLQEDIKKNINGKMITLTFSDESIEALSREIKLKGYNLDNAIATLATRRFLERWRKKYKTSLRHWLVTELGHNGTENIHMHGIIWTNETVETVHKIWGYGHTWPRPERGWKGTWVNNQTVNYTIKYVHKQDEKHTTYKSIILTSAGIGGNYTNSYNAKLNKYNEKKTNEAYRTKDGYKISMPVYWRNKIYNDEERERLWIERLNKQERWICGERVDVSTKEGQERYWRLLKWHQAKNIRLGYGAQNDEQRWEKRKYEDQLRQAQIMKRVQKAWSKENKAKQGMKLGRSTHS
jgi:hypothetical protein